MSFVAFFTISIYFVFLRIRQSFASEKVVWGPQRIFSIAFSFYKLDFLSHAEIVSVRRKTRVYSFLFRSNTFKIFISLFTCWIHGIHIPRIKKIEFSPRNTQFSHRIRSLFTRLHQIGERSKYATIIRFEADKFRLSSCNRWENIKARLRHENVSIFLCIAKN